MAIKAVPGSRAHISHDLQDARFHVRHSVNRGGSHAATHALKGAAMSSTGLEVFDTTVHKTNIWLKEIAQPLGSDRHRAYQALRAVLHSLRDRLTIDEAAQLGDQLPMLVRGIYYEAWHPAGKPEKIRTREEFLARVAAHFGKVLPMDPEDAARAVFQVLENHVAPGEIRDVIRVLPQDIRTLWPPLPVGSQDVV
jgi:uncharacterized protein (DUF2267 family)